MCPSHESDISTDKRAGVWLGLSVPSLVMGQLTVKEPATPAQEGKDFTLFVRNQKVKTGLSHSGTIGEADVPTPSDESINGGLV